MFIPRRIFLVDFFVQEKGKGPKNRRYLNTPQEESNKFEIRTWNLNLVFFKFPCVEKFELKLGF
jgi:hypothetical protein